MGGLGKGCDCDGRDLREFNLVNVLMKAFKLDKFRVVSDFIV